RSKRPSARQDLACDLARADDRRPRQRAPLTGVDPERDVGIEHLHERVEIAAARGLEERLDHAPLRREVTVGLRCTANATPRSACELASRVGGALDDRSDLL